MAVISIPHLEDFRITIHFFEEKRQTESNPSLPPDPSSCKKAAVCSMLFYLRNFRITVLFFWHNRGKRSKSSAAVAPIWLLVLTPTNGMKRSWFMTAGCCKVQKALAKTQETVFCSCSPGFLSGNLTVQLFNAFVFGNFLHSTWPFQANDKCS